MSKKIFGKAISMFMAVVMMTASLLAFPGMTTEADAQTVTIQAPANLEYDGNQKAATANSGGTTVDAEKISYQKKNTDNTWTAINTAPTDAGTYKASITVGTGTGIKTADVEYTIERKQLTISTEDGKKTTVYNKTYEGKTTASAEVGTVEGIVGSDQVNVAIDSATFADKNAGANKTVTVTYKLSGDDAGNYIEPAADSTLKADISRKQLSVTGTTVNNKTYDGTKAAEAHIGTVSGICTGDEATVAVKVKSAQFEDENAADDKTVTVTYEVTGTDSGNYTAPVDESATANISKKAITITADDKTTYVGSDIEALTYTYAAADLISGDSFTGTLATSADKTKVDQYDITQGTLAISDGNNGNNYTISYTKGTYTVTDKEIQTLDFAGVTDGKVSKTYGDAAFTEKVSGAQTTVTYSSSDENVATVDPATGEVTILKAGTAIIKATAAESYKYAPASAQYTLTVNRKQLAIDVEHPTIADQKTYDGTTTANANMGTVTGIVGEDKVTVQIDTATFADKNAENGKTVTVTYKITGDDAGNYIAPVKDTTIADIVSKQLTISTEDGKKTTVSNKTYDGKTTASAEVGTATGIVGEDKVTVQIDTADFADKNAGANKTVTVTYKLSGDDAGNYIEPADDSTLKASIAPKQLSVTGTTVNNKTYDGTAAAEAHIGTVNGICTGDEASVTVKVKSAQFEDENAADGKTVTVTYEATGADSGNYTAPADYSTTANISKKTITITADNKATYVGSDIAALTYTYAAADLISGDSFTGELATAADKTKTGTYDITQGTLAIDDGNGGANYTISYNKGTYTVTDKEIQTLVFAGVTDGNVSKTYGDAAFTEKVSGAHTTVTYSSSDETVAKVNAATGEVTILKAGTAIIKATAAESAEYAEGSAQYILTVSKAKVDIPTAVTGLTYNGCVQIGVVLPAGTQCTLTGNNRASEAGSYTAIAALKDKENYEWNLDTPSSENQNILWCIQRAEATVTAENKEMSLGEKVPSFTATVTGLIGLKYIINDSPTGLFGNKIKYSFNTINPDAQGVYSIVPTGDKIQGNYNVTYKQGTLTVNKIDNAAKANEGDISKVLQKYQEKEEYSGNTLDIEVRTDQKVSEESKNEISKLVPSGKEIQFTETNIFLIVKSDEGTYEKNIGDEIDTLISITYEFDFTNKRDIQVFRAHETKNEASQESSAAGDDEAKNEASQESSAAGDDEAKNETSAECSTVVDELEETPNEDGEYAILDKKAGTITVVAKKYSTFAFVYNVDVPKTGDQSNLWLYILLLVIAVLAATGAVAAKKHSRE